MDLWRWNLSEKVGGEVCGSDLEVMVPKDEYGNRRTNKIMANA